MSRRSKIVFVTIAIVVAAILPFRHRIVRATTPIRIDVALSRARIALNDPRVLRVRMTAGDRSLGAFVASAFTSAEQPAARLRIAETLSGLAEHSSGDQHARATGMAHMLAGQCQAAAQNLARIQIRNAADWNDLGAASVCTAQQQGLPEAWLTALTSVDRALVLDPALAEAHFNRATIVDAFGIAPLARSLWQGYVGLDPDSRWSHFAKQRLAAASVPSDAEAWKAADARIGQFTPPELISLTNKYPQAARRYADAMYLPLWAKAMEAGDHSAARRHLEIARTIARTLQRRGEPLLADAVGAVDAAAISPERQRELIAGTLDYFDGRRALHVHDASTAERKLRSGMVRLRRAETPFALVAEFWLACALTEQNRMAEAAQVLDSVRSREAAALQRYPSWAGHVHYQIALIEAMSGNWTASLAAAERSRAAFAALGERGNVANATGMMSENYDFLGQPQRAWEAGLVALRESAADGAYDRMRAMLAGLCRTELRGSRWERARSLARLEAAIVPFAADARMEPDMFIRRAAAEWHLANHAAAVHFVGLAETAAKRIGDKTIRTKLLADVAAAEGAFVRRSDPVRSIALFSTAIAFQRDAGRPFIVPELYLQRGRTYLTLGNLDAAEADFEAGLSELERQRSAVSEAELRPGIFDDAAQLFDESITLQIRRGADAERVLRYVERGRARAVLEQIDARDDSWTAQALPRIADLQSRLTPGAALIEYVSLPDQLLAFVITRDRTVMRTTPVSRRTLTSAAAMFLRNRGADGATLHGMLIAPLRNDLHGVRAMNIVADDFLQRVPFSALFDPTTKRFLVQDYEFAGSPSAGVLIAGLTRSNLPVRSPATALVFANPAVPREQFGNLASLAGAEYEANRIARHYERFEVFTRTAATAERFFALAPTHDFVHFAGHGVINEREPYASALVCAATPRTPGGVTARDIARMDFRSTRAVVLAACSTMTGRNAAIEGVPSLARAFLIAGVPAVIGTLWDIEDGEAAAITHPLHRHFSRGVQPSQALRMAQLAAIERGVPPSQWSAFALMGNVQ